MGEKKETILEEPCICCKEEITDCVGEYAWDDLTQSVGIFCTECLKTIQILKRRHKRERWYEYNKWYVKGRNTGRQTRGLFY